MPPWLLKAAVQGITAQLPSAQRVNRLFQRARGSLVLDKDTLATKLRGCRKHLDYYASHGGRPNPVVVELGTGWFPIAPIGFALCGASAVYSVDIVSHLEREQVVAVLRGMLASAHHLGIDDSSRLAPIEHALATPDLDATALLAAAGVTQIIGDARTLDLGRPIDLITSNNVLEHIPYEVLYGMFRHFHGLLGPTGIMSHWIDMSDHYMNFDSSIGPYNFLKFSESVWQLFNNRHQYQNRLRVSDFRTLHALHDWTMLHEENRSGTPDELRRIRIAPQFKRYTEADLLVTQTWMISRPSAT